MHIDPRLATVLAVILLIAGAVIVIVVRKLALRTVGLRGRLGMPALLLSGGLAVGSLAWLAELLGANSQDVLFSGQTSVPTVVAEDSTKVIAVLIVAKLLAYAVSLGCGFRGGAIFPAIFLGIALASFAVVWFDVSPTLAVAVGAAAGMAAQTRLIFSPLIFATLLVGSQNADVIPATVFATAGAWLTVKTFDRRAERTQAAAGAPKTS